MLARTSSQTCGRWYLPTFLFKDGSLTLIYIASLIVLIWFKSSLPTISKLLMVTWWPLMLLWSCMGEGDFRCSLNLSPNVLEDSPMYSSSQDEKPTYPHGCLPLLAKRKDRCFSSWLLSLSYMLPMLCECPQSQVRLGEFTIVPSIFNTPGRIPLHAGLWRGNMWIKEDYGHSHVFPVSVKIPISGESWWHFWMPLVSVNTSQSKKDRRHSWFPPVTVNASSPKIKMTRARGCKVSVIIWG